MTTRSNLEPAEVANFARARIHESPPADTQRWLPSSAGKCASSTPDMEVFRARQHAIYNAHCLFLQAKLPIIVLRQELHIALRERPLAVHIISQLPAQIGSKPPCTISTVLDQPCGSEALHNNRITLDASLRPKPLTTTFAGGHHPL